MKRLLKYQRSLFFFEVRRLKLSVHLFLVFSLYFYQVFQSKAMKKFLVFIVLFILFSHSVFAQDFIVSQEDASLVAQNFYFERVQSHKPVPVEKISLSGTYMVEKDEVPLYYIFNMSTGGFVVVSASQVTPPVLCYSFTGNYNPDDQPDNFKAWMGQYERQISYAISTKAERTPAISTLWDYYLETPAASLKAFSGREVAPLTTSTWNQGMYYNELCPADPAGPGGHCVTGCVATTLGQILNYFRWPDSGTGSYSYECPPYGTLSVDFSDANYRYDLMETSLNHSNVEVAEVIYHLGVSVDMVYGPNGSGMYNHKAAYTLKTFFKYSPETQYVFRDSTTMDWDSLLVSHLDRNIPLYYAGWSVPDTNGHAFVCDGYQGEDFYHFNWGWGGSYDGYFYTDNLTPGGNFFNLAQELVINAVPDTNLYTYPSYCTGQNEYEALFGTIGDGSGPIYPYENGASCSWLITPNDSVNGITLNFLQFGTDPGDTVTVYDGDNNNAPLLGQFSGYDAPSSISTEGNRMLVEFESGPESNGDGFLASFESEIPVFCSGMVMLSNQSDTLTDGSGNWDYHNNSACLWRIMPEGASSVTLFFEEFETEEGSDILKIYDLQTQQLLAEYSGIYESGVPDPVTSPSGKMFITFNTNQTNTAPGWTAYYESNLVNIDETIDNTAILIFPNPTDGMITVKQTPTRGGPVKLSITDLAGRLVYSCRIEEMQVPSFNIDLRHLIPGIYVMKSEDETGVTHYNKVIIR
jgi:hypothetical protein